MVNIYTAQYKYSGEDRLDITVKGNDPIGRIFAPTWEMVRLYKDYKNEINYVRSYHLLMQRSYRINRKIWEEILNRDSVTLVCFCKENSFCHRYLLAEYLEKCGGKYLGERSI